MQQTRCYQPYSNSEIIFIKENYTHLTSTQLAAKLNRTKPAVDSIKRKYNLKSGKRKGLSKSIIISAYLERKKMIVLNKTVTEMNKLIELASNEVSLLKKAQYIAKLKKLSGLT